MTIAMAMAMAMAMAEEKEKGEEIIRKPLMIAMKGHPGSGKSTLARALASTLKLPLLDKDDVCHPTFHLQHLSSSSSSSTTSQQLLNDLSYEAIWRVALTQLHIGLSRIIDSPLSLSQNPSSPFARLGGIDWSPPPDCGVSAVERGRVKGEAGREGKELAQATHLIGASEAKGYGGCPDYDVGHVPKVLGDTTAPNLWVQELVPIVVDFIASSCGKSVGQYSNDVC